MTTTYRHVRYCQLCTLVSLYQTYKTLYCSVPIVNGQCHTEDVVEVDVEVIRRHAGDEAVTLELFL